MSALMLWMFLSVAGAAVPDDAWGPLVGQDVVLVNPAGKQIKGHLLSADGNEIVILREKDQKRFTIPKSDIESAELRDNSVPGGIASPDEVKEKAAAAAEVAGEATAGVVGEAKDSTADAVEGVGEKLGDVASNLRDEPEPTVQADPGAPELERPVLEAGTTYADGLEAGRLAADDDKSLLPLGVAAGATCCATAVPCAVVPVLGGCAGLAVGAAGPVYYAGVRPYVVKDKLAADVVNEPTEYAAGYVRGYTDTIQRRETVLAGIGSAAGLATGLVVGYVGYSLIIGGI
ncbi:MAG: hypothetical protein GY913_03795 [Proteobacteria bacterium]|nr:hypothetical protein [Pseudomonadota bacterium]